MEDIIWYLVCRHRKKLRFQDTTLTTADHYSPHRTRDDVSQTVVALCSTALGVIATKFEGC